MSIEGTYFNTKMAGEPTANIIPNGEELKAFPLRAETMQGCSILLLLFNIILEGLARAIR